VSVIARAYPDAAISADDALLVMEIASLRSQ